MKKTNRKLEQYKEVAERAIEDAQAAKNDIKDAVNWGDLHVTDLEEYKRIYGDKGIRIYIEEAAPDSSQLIEFVRNYFEHEGLSAPDVVCEW